MIAVFAVDLRGFGDSGNGPGAYDSAVASEDLHLRIEGVDQERGGTYGTATSRPGRSSPR
jgi:hypothetical protein